MDTSILFSQDQIEKKIQELAKNINQVYKKNMPLMAIGILKGAFMFYTELLRYLHQEVVCDFCSISFYGSSLKATQEAYISFDVKSPIKNRHILLIDCIADYGHSLSFVKNYLKQREPASLKTAVLITKPLASKKVQIDFKGFEVKQDIFVVGYGLDYKGEGRGLNHLAQVNNLKLN